MAQLVFYKDRQELIRYVLQKESTSVGRGATSDVCLPDSNVSRTHFVIVSNNGKFMLTDKSTNGTMLNKLPVISQELKDNDRISMGDWEIVFSFETAIESQTATVHEERDPTEVLSYQPEQRELKFRRGYLERLDGKAPSLFPIRKELIAIGKSKSNDIVISHDTYISNFHCKIEFRRGRYFLKDLKSTNGTYLNKQPIIEVSLANDSIISVGKTDFRFYMAEESEKLKPASEKNFHGIIGASSKMRSLYAVLKRVAMSDATILIQGETGVGKELVARAVHQLSARVDKKLITLNCAAIAKDLIESELFGHEKGAFTSAFQQRRGAFEEASGGTLFLDEIGDMPMELQPKLLRVLENREVKRVGSNALIDIDVRVVAATNQDLVKMVKKGQFREDLYYRLYVVPIAIPPLRERIEDIPLLVGHFLAEVRGKQKHPKGFTAKAMEALEGHSWPGNVRELKNLISRAALQATGEMIDVKNLNFSPQLLKEMTTYDPKALNSEQAPAAPLTLKDFERERILQELTKYNWNKRKAAEALGIAKTTLFEKIKRYHLKPE